MSKDPEEELGRLDEQQRAGLKPGVNLRQLGALPVVVFCGPRGQVQHAFRNVCRHNNGRFVRDPEDPNCLRCPLHGWRLDARTLQYTNPPDILSQEHLLLREEGGDLVISDRVPDRPWEAGRQMSREDLAAGELTLTHLSHASLEIQAAGARLVTDPWYTGPAFGLGWWLAHRTEADVYERAARADAIYISHNHSDHLNIPTLERIRDINRDVPIYVGKLERPVWTEEAGRLGFRRVHEVELGEWVELGPNTRFMILGDALVPELDTFLLFEHKGHRVLDFVDAAMPNGLELPSVDVALSDFASGASGFPSTFTDMFSEDEITDHMQGKRKQFLQKTALQIIAAEAKVWIPFAGYFTEAHPHDADTRRLNRKNTPEEACAYVERRVPLLETWIPFPGGRFDLATRSGDVLPARESYEATGWDFSTYVDAIRESARFPALDRFEGLQHYFEWAGFRDYDACLHIVEQDDELRETIRSFWIDCVDARVHEGEPPFDRDRFRMRARTSMLRHVMRHGLTWDLLYIGFQCRYSVEPDVFHFKLMQHFATGLPSAPPRWEELPSGRSEYDQV